MTRLLVAVGSLCFAATLSLVALANAETPHPQSAGSATPEPLGAPSRPSVPPPLASPTATSSAPATPPATTAPAPATSTASSTPPVSEAASSPEAQPQAVTKSLDVDYQAQLTGYWCGPAAARIALSSKTNNLPDQGTLAGEIGTTENGTDQIGQVVDGLNKQLAGTGTRYVARVWGGDPVTSAMTQQLWTDIVRDVNGGKGLVANIVAPPGNQPPGYPSSETIYHYVAIVGYDSAKKKVHISDPARFSGIEEYWLSLDQVASLIQPKGYAA